ncbi:MAG: hypothetical protein CM1200mP36_02790 [Gammaproteobacteria bacterium]|nr:MAG: hypothetical protein CM1200mP36_02790 [Gammaproteobacteria bacterium]
MHEIKTVQHEKKKTWWQHQGRASLPFWTNSRERERYKVPYGAILNIRRCRRRTWAAHCEWDPHTHPVVTEVGVFLSSKILWMALRSRPSRRDHGADEIVVLDPAQRSAGTDFRPTAKLVDKKGGLCSSRIQIFRRSMRCLRVPSSVWKMGDGSCG